MSYDRTQPKKYEEKCDVQMLILLTETQKRKLILLSEKKVLKQSQVIRDLLEKEFELNNIN